MPSGKARQALYDLVSFVKAKMDEGKNVMVHCHNGVGRSGAFVPAVILSGLDTTKKLSLFDFVIEFRRHRPRASKRSVYFKIMIEQMRFSKIK